MSSSDCPAVSRRRIGVLGGTFDPVHVGHLRPAYDVCSALALDEVRLVPCHQTPHRPQPARPSALRAEMVELAVADMPGFVVDQREMQHDAPSYTYDTLRSMREEDPGASLYFMLGVDSLNGFDGWYRWQDIPTLAHLVLMRRPGYELNAFAQALLLERGASFEDARGASAGCIVSLRLPN